MRAATLAEGWREALCYVVPGARWARLAGAFDGAAVDWAEREYRRTGPHRRAGARAHRPYGAGPWLQNMGELRPAGHLSDQRGTEGRLSAAVESEDRHGAHFRAALRSDRRPLPRGGGGPSQTTASGHDGR